MGGVGVGVGVDVCVCYLCGCHCVRYMKVFFTLFQAYKKLQLDYTFTYNKPFSPALCFYAMIITDVDVS